MAKLNFQSHYMNGYSSLQKSFWYDDLVHKKHLLSTLKMVVLLNIFVKTDAIFQMIWGSLERTAKY